MKLFDCVVAGAEFSGLLDELGFLSSLDFASGSDSGSGFGGGSDSGSGGGSGSGFGGGSSSGAGVDEEVERNIGVLIGCANRVIREVCQAYVTLLHEQEFEVGEDGVVLFSGFERCPTRVLGAFRGESKTRYLEFPDRMLFESAGRVRVRYAFVPRALELGDEVPIREGLCDARVLGYGIAAEFLLLNGQFNEAMVWDRRYRDNLRGNSRPHRTMPPISVR